MPELGVRPAPASASRGHEPIPPDLHDDLTLLPGLAGSPSITGEMRRGRGEEAALARNSIMHCRKSPRCLQRRAENWQRHFGHPSIRPGPSCANGNGARRRMHGRGASSRPPLALPHFPGRWRNSTTGGHFPRWPDRGLTGERAVAFWPRKIAEGDSLEAPSDTRRSWHGDWAAGGIWSIRICTHVFGSTPHSCSVTRATRN
jgi:hypothetical protein